MEIRDGKKYFQIRIRFKRVAVTVIFLCISAWLAFAAPTMGIREEGDEAIIRYGTYLFNCLGLLASSFALFYFIAYVKCQCIPTFIVVDNENVNLPFFPCWDKRKIKLTNIVSVKADPKGLGRQITVQYRNRLIGINEYLLDVPDEISLLAKALMRDENFEINFNKSGPVPLP